MLGFLRIRKRLLLVLSVIFFATHILYSDAKLKKGEGDEGHARDRPARKIKFLNGNDDVDENVHRKPETRTVKFRASGKYLKSTASSKVLFLKSRTNITS